MERNNTSVSSGRSGKKKTGMGNLKIVGNSFRHWYTKTRVLNIEQII